MQLAVPSAKIVFVNIPHNGSHFPAHDDHVWKIQDLQAGGLSLDTDVVYHYRRNEVGRVISKLNAMVVSSRLTSQNKKEIRCWISGSPGIGTSTTLFGWLSNMGERMNAIWFHRVVPGTYVVVHMNKGVWSRILLRSVDIARTIIATVKDIDILVLDGFEKNNIDMLFSTAVIKHQKSCIIACTSFGASRFSSGDSVLLNFAEFISNSWTLDEYIECERLHITNVCDSESITRQYYYAGGSMKYFHLPIIDIERKIPKDINALYNITDVLKGVLGQCTDRTINSLFQTHGGHVDIVSDYAKFVISNRADLSFVVEARRMVPDNPVWLGWVLELEFRVRIRKGPVKVEVFNVEEVIEFPRSEILHVWSAKDLTSVTLRNGTWIIPRKWNQGCFDFIYYREQGDVIGFNVTRGSKHSVNFEYLLPFLQLLGKPRNNVTQSLVDRLAFYYIVDHENEVEADVSGLENIQQYCPSFTLASIKTTKLKSEINLSVSSTVW